MDIKEEICEIGRRMYAKELICGYEGNISVRVSDNEIWTTPTGVCKGFLTPDMLVCVDINGTPIDNKKPSSELKMHLRVYRERADVQAVVHAHPTYATAFAAAGKALDKFYLTENIITLGEIYVAPYATPSTEEVPDSIAPFLKGCKAVLLANHGALTWAKTLQDAYFLMESVESAAKTTFITEQLGAKEIFVRLL
ncbi:MAG: class II aldolase/adducin family protein [Deferribacteraceae bacterium]|jgi:L-fuculose-phosphate aldolase|nr:class II aldolase/adducin family protein [Deferribacteraceae bacterium]